MTIVAAVLFYAAFDGPPRAIAHRAQTVLCGVGLFGLVAYLARFARAWRCGACRSELDEAYLLFPRSQPAEIVALIERAHRGENIESIHTLVGEAMGAPTITALELLYCPTCGRAARVSVGTYHWTITAQRFEPTSAPVMLAGDTVEVLLR